MLNNEQSQQHKMVLKSTTESGFEEWYCPACGRRFLMHWPPEYKKTILEPGDENATHTGGKGLPGMELNIEPSVNQPVTSDSLDEPMSVIDDEKLIPWENWMEKVDFESLWDSPLQ
jgi:hypothetical protein